MSNLDKIKVLLEDTNEKDLNVIAEIVYTTLHGVLTLDDLTTTFYGKQIPYRNYVPSLWFFWYGVVYRRMMYICNSNVIKDDFQCLENPAPMIYDDSIKGVTHSIFSIDFLIRMGYPMKYYTKVGIINPDY